MTELPGPAIPKPILPVGDMAAAREFYRRLGFSVVSYDEGYAWVRHGGEEMLHLRRVDDLDVGANRASAYLHVQDVDGWYRAMPPGTASEPADMPWGMRECAFTDPSGNLVRVGQNL